MMLYNIESSPALANNVRFYRLMDFSFGANETAHTKAYRPRIEHCLQFMPRDTEHIKYPATGQDFTAKKVSLVGQHNILNHRKVGRNYLNIQVVFKPGALLRLTGIPAQQLTNNYLDAEAILGPEVHLVNEQLYHAADYAKMIDIIERYLMSLQSKANYHGHHLDKVAYIMLGPHKHSIDWYAQQSCMSYRTFDRRFKEITGVCPKDYLGMVQLDKAYLLKNRYPERDWLSIAVESGYYDHQHLSKAYKNYTGYSPNSFFELEKKAPERHFGQFEQ